MIIYFLPGFIKRYLKRTRCIKNGHEVYEIGFNQYAECGVCGETDTNGNYDKFWGLVKRTKL